MAYRSFEDLEVWRRACDLAVSTYEHLRNCSDLALCGQMQRASVSIASNIAEGSERDSSKDTIRFLRVAKASAAELRTQLHIAERIGYLPAEAAASMRQETKEISSMIQGLIAHFQRQK